MKKEQRAKANGSTGQARELAAKGPADEAVTTGPTAESQVDEDTSTISKKPSSGDAGSYGYLLAPEPPALPDDEELDSDDFGMKFIPVAKSEPTPTSEPAPEPEPEPIDSRNHEQLRQEALQQITNALDWPPNVVAEARLNLQNRTGELRDHVMRNIVPVVLAVDPALVSVEHMVPRMFDNGADIEVTMNVESLKHYAAGLGVMATRIKIIEMLNFPEEIKARLMANVVPTRQEGPRHE